jgi:hypothetical protein
MLQKGRIALHRLVLPLLCTPFLLAQLIAPGTMAIGGPQGLRMVLCAGEAAMTVVLTADGDFIPVDETEDDHGQSGASCPWALAFDHSAIAIQPVVAENMATPARLDLSRTDIEILALAARHGPPARAPPFTV